MGHECPECGVYNGNRLYSHLFYAHSYTTMDIERLKEKKRDEKVLATCVDSKIYTCSLCGLSYAKRDSLLHHSLAKHKEAVASDVRKGLKCPLCGKEVKIQRRFVEHVKLAHSVNPDEYSIENIVFDDKKLYEKWRLLTEQKCNLKWVIVSTKTLGDKRIYHFRCKMAMPWPGYAKGRRRSKKLVPHCTAFMEVIELGNKYEVEYCTTHFGHGSAPELMDTDQESKQIVPLRTVPNLLRSNKYLLRRFDEEVAALRSKLSQLSEIPGQQVNEHLSMIVGIIKDAGESTSTVCSSYQIADETLSSSTVNTPKVKQSITLQQVKEEK